MIFEWFYSMESLSFLSSTSALSRDSSRSGQISAMDCNLSASGANLANFFFLCAALLPSSFCCFSRFRAYTAHFANFPILCGLIMRLILLTLDQIFFAHLRGQAKAFMLLAKFARHN